MCFAVIGAPIASFVRQRVDERNTQLAERQDFNVAIDPEILDVIQNSTAISTSKGSAAMLCKIGSKRRRTRAEMDEFHAQQASQFEAMQAKDEEIQNLQRELNGSKRKSDQAQRYEKLVNEMLASGELVMDEDGSFRIVRE